VRAVHTSTSTSTLVAVTAVTAIKTHGASLATGTAGTLGALRAIEASKALQTKRSEKALVSRGSTHTIAAIRPSRARSAVLALEASGAGRSDVSGKTNVALGVDVAPEIEASLGKIAGAAIGTIRSILAHAQVLGWGPDR